jgi:flavodoxin I
VPMKSYLEQLGSLKGKKVALLVTGAFPAGSGRNQTLARLEEICKAKGAAVCGSGSVGWLSLGRKREIAKVVDQLSALF